MDWRSITFDWNRARAFLVTAEEGSLSAAARALGMTQPTLGRQVAALEADLGVTLFERSGRGLTLTGTGRDLVEHVRAMSEAATRVSLTASGRATALEGTVRITATEVAAAFHLPGILTELRRAHPGIHVELVATNQVQNLRRREADIALRSGRPDDPELIATRLGQGLAGLYAAREYLDRHGPFATPEALARAEFIGFDDNDGLLRGLSRRGIPLTLGNFAYSCTSHLVIWELLRAGAGVGVMVRDVADADPKVADAAPWLKPLAYDLWLVAHRELRTSRRVRIVFDWLARAFRDRLAQPGPAPDTPRWTEENSRDINILEPD